MKEAEKHYNLAQEFIEKGLMDEAIKELREAIKIYPEYAEAHYLLGFQLMNTNQDEAATELYEGIRLNPELFDELIKSFETKILNDLPGDEEAVKVLNLLKLMSSIAKYISSDEQDNFTGEKKDKDSYEDIRHDSTYSSERKNMDKNLAMEIIAKALNTATNGGLVKAELGPYKGKIMSAEQVQKLGLKKEDLIEAFLKDPRVISAECENGKFHINTTDGKFSFNFIFEDEKKSGSA